MGGSGSKVVKFTNIVDMGRTTTILMRGSNRMVRMDVGTAMPCTFHNFNCSLLHHHQHHYYLLAPAISKRVSCAYLIRQCDAMKWLASLVHIHWTIVVS